VPLSLPAESSVFVVFRKPATTTHGEVRAVHDVPLGTLGAATGRPAASRVMPAGWSRSRPAGCARFAGHAYLGAAGPECRARRALFLRHGDLCPQLPPAQGLEEGQPLWLDLGEVHDIAQVTVNGQDLGTQWHAPYRFDVGSAVHNGTNAIQVRVANSWVNRLIGDAQPGATKVTWTAIPTYNADARCGRRAWLARSRWARPAEPVAATGHSALSPPLLRKALHRQLTTLTMPVTMHRRIWWCCATGKDAQEWASNFCPPWRLLRWGPAWGQLGVGAGSRCPAGKPCRRRSARIRPSRR
jgi:hypothetical protein